MANPRRGEVEIELAGETRKLVFDFNVISEIESAFGDKTLEELFFEPMKKQRLSRRFILEAIRAGLSRAERKEYTSVKIGALITQTLGDSGIEALALLTRAVAAGIMAAHGAKPDAIGEIADAQEADDARPPQAPEIGTP